ncbi:DUF2975 domain-containing protein [Sphingomonas sp. PB4P5]|uniref:DUF2975 domain-containing protein n=1 Tax=Parasphingomonas puruogangriensis TaxID=3096155 RepID=UPI002FC5BBB4
MNDRLLRIGGAVLTVANILNWVCVAGFVAALLLSFPFAPAILARLAAKYAMQPAEPVLQALRVMLVLGLAVGPPLHIIFTRLRAIVATAEAGDPFVAPNARRLQAAAWALLVIQLLDLVIGALTWALAGRHIDTAGWSPSFGGWFSVLLLFILARVFAAGTRMRDELEITV